MQTRKAGVLPPLGPRMGSYGLGMAQMFTDRTQLSDRFLTTSLEIDTFSFDEHEV